MLRQYKNALISLSILAPCAAAALFAACAKDDENVVSGDGTGGRSNPNETGGATFNPDATVNVPPGTTTPAYVDLRDPWPAGSNTWIEPGVPATAPADFDAATAGATAPELVYPLPNSMHPKNLLNIGFHWWKHDRTDADTIARLVITGGSETFYLYFNCAGSPRACVKGVQGDIRNANDLGLPNSEWFDLGERFGGQPITLTLEELDAGVKYTAAPITITFSPEAVLGTLYYWAAAGNRIRRASFGASTAVDFITPNSATNAYVCAACHGVSRNGEVIGFAVTSTEGESVGAIQFAPTRDPAAPFYAPPPGATPFTDPNLTHDGLVTTGPTAGFGHNVALSPDGKFGAVNGIPISGWPPFLEIRDTATGAAVANYPLGHANFGSGKLAIMPEYSPDGTLLLANMTDSTATGNCPNPTWSYSTCSGGISVLPVDPVSGQITGAAMPVTTAPPGYFHYYPTWSPDATHVAFVVAQAGGSDANKSDQNDLGELYLVPFGGNYTCPGDPACVKLANGMFVDGQHATTPKFAPFSQAGGQISFITYASRMPYGRATQGGKNQLWMFGIDLRNAGDPSYAPFWVPYQEAKEENLTPYWAMVAPCESADGGGCSGCLESEECYVYQATNTCTCVPRIVQ